jgi:hypothetical protein
LRNPTLGFVPLPGAYFVFLGGVTMTYLVLVELVKRRLMRKLLGTGPATPATISVTSASWVPRAVRDDRGGSEMATDAEIRKFVQRHHGFIPKTGWIAHVKEVHGVPTLRGANRARRGRDVEPCPQEKREAIEEALRHFGVI